LAGIAEDRLLDLLRTHTSALDCSSGRDHTHVGCCLRGERASKLADGRPDCGKNIDGLHVLPPKSLSLAGDSNVVKNRPKDETSPRDLPSTE
jgi:hypothetical protein